MAYATQADLVPLRISLPDLIELTSDTEDVDDAVVTGALNEASTIVDSYCSRRYKVPLQPSAMATSIAIDIALYKLATRRRDTRPNETWTTNYQTAMKTLRDIGEGKASLDIEAAAPAEQLSSAGVTVTQKRQTYDDCNLKGFC